MENCFPELFETFKNEFIELCKNSYTFAVFGDDGKDMKEILENLKGDGHKELGLKEQDFKLKFSNVNVFNTNLWNLMFKYFEKIPSKMHQLSSYRGQTHETMDVYNV